MSYKETRSQCMTMTLESKSTFIYCLGLGHICHGGRGVSKIYGH